MVARPAIQDDPAAGSEAVSMRPADGERIPRSCRLHPHSPDPSPEVAARSMKRPDNRHRIVIGSPRNSGRRDLCTAFSVSSPWLCLWVSALP